VYSGVKARPGAATENGGSLDQAAAYPGDLGERVSLLLRRSRGGRPRQWVLHAKIGNMNALRRRWPPLRGPVTVT